MPETPSCQLLDWDTSFFGFRVARLTTATLSSTGARQTLDWCMEHDVSTLYYLCPAADTASQRVAKDSGFRLVDIRVTFGTDLLPLAPASTPPRCQVRLWQPADLPALKALSAGSHHDTRFYSDPFFPRDLCDRLYATWIERSCHGYDDRVWVSENSAGVSGYITGSIRDGIGRISLLAVAERSRHQGCGSSLVATALDWFCQSGATAGQVVTQGSNLTAQRLYGRAGFVPRATDLWYHWHPPPKSG